MINGTTLIVWGFKPGPYFKDMLVKANELDVAGADETTIRAELEAAMPKAPAVMRRRAGPAFHEAIEARTDDEKDNLAAVRLHMTELMRTPVIEAGTIMPDACPAGQPLGTIPVGGAVASRGIHPAFHSADICCSMHVTLFEPGTDPAEFMDALQASTHFGPGGRREGSQIPDPITDELERTRNPFLKQLGSRAKYHLATQGDGNHFAYLGKLGLSIRLLDKLDPIQPCGLSDALELAFHHDARQVLALVTHHGSRDLGAQVYKRGQEAAIRQTKQLSPDTPPWQAWLDPESEDGAAYWEALDYVRRWTKRNHELVHELTAARLGIKPLTAFGNEHNFVWQRDGLFYHGKGATPAWADDAGNPLLGVIPLNMASPILLTLGKGNPDALGFSPHGAGRNYSRTSLLKKVGLHGLEGEAYLRRSREMLAEQTAGLDVRFWFDRPDVSETPMAYKDAATVRGQIDQFGLAEVIGEITPLGCLMAGDYDKPWLVKKVRKQDEQADAVE